jgi:hypothetical protein
VLPGQLLTHSGTHFTSASLNQCPSEVQALTTQVTTTKLQDIQLLAEVQ